MGFVPLTVQSLAPLTRQVRLYLPRIHSSTSMPSGHPLSSNVSLKSSWSKCPPSRTHALFQTTRYTLRLCQACARLVQMVHRVCWVSLTSIGSPHMEHLTSWRLGPRTRYSFLHSLHWLACPPVSWALRSKSAQGLYLWQGKDPRPPASRRQTS